MGPNAPTDPEILTIFTFPERKEERERERDIYIYRDIERDREG